MGLFYKFINWIVGYCGFNQYDCYDIWEIGLAFIMIPFIPLAFIYREVIKIKLSDD